MNHQVGRWVFAIVIGLIVALFSYRWITNPAPRVERQLEEAAVFASRGHLQEMLAINGLQIVDPVSPDRKVGKTYVYRAGEGWEVSGFYRRNEDDPWHPYLVTLDAQEALTRLRVQDAALLDKAASNDLLEVLP